MVSNKKYYDSIINDKLGKGYEYSLNRIKEACCSKCDKRNKNTCRLKISNDKCDNYKNKKLNKVK